MNPIKEHPLFKLYRCDKIIKQKLNLHIKNSTNHTDHSTGQIHLLAKLRFVFFSPLRMKITRSPAVHRERERAQAIKFHWFAPNKCSFVHNTAQSGSVCVCVFVFFLQFKNRYLLEIYAVKSGAHNARF